MVLIIGEGDYTTFVTAFTGTLTIARWRDGRIVEEYLKYDNAGFMQQIGLA